MGEQVHVAWTEHETAAQLKSVPAQLVLPVPRGLRSCARLRVIGPRQMQQGSRLQTRFPIREPLFIDQKRKANTGILAEKTGVRPVTETDGRRRRMFFRESILVFAQLRDVLAAEQSAVMAKENDHGRLPFPERAEPVCAPIGVRQRDGSEPRAERFGHAAQSTSAKPRFM